MVGFLCLVALRTAARGNVRQFGMSLELRHVTQAKVAPLQVFIEEAERRLPPRLKAAIQHGVVVEFAALDAKHEITPPPCPDASSTTTAQTLAEFTLSQNDAPHHIVLSTKCTTFWRRQAPESDRASDTRCFVWSSAQMIVRRSVRSV